MGVGGLALATSISATVGVVSLMLLLRRRLGRLRARRTFNELIKIAMATALCALVCLALNRVMPAAAIFLRVRWAARGVAMIREKLHR